MLVMLLRILVPILGLLRLVASTDYPSWDCYTEPPEYGGKWTNSDLANLEAERSVIVCLSSSVESVIICYSRLRVQSGVGRDRVVILMLPMCL